MGGRVRSRLVVGGGRGMEGRWEMTAAVKGGWYKRRERARARARVRGRREGGREGEGRRGLETSAAITAAARAGV